jgi:hypothetical protein
MLMTHRKERLGLVSLGVVIVGLLVFKWKSLGLPLYWDEAWVYGPAVRAMTANGISLLPNTIGPSLSRGHPLLFHATASIWCKIFGTSNLSIHCFALLTSITLLCVIYRVGCKMGSPLIGISAVMLTALNEAFLAQSTLLLPETSLALLTLIAIDALSTRNWLKYIIASSCALLVKESAIVLICVAILWTGIDTFSTNHLKKTRIIKELIYSVIPIFPITIFLFYQKAFFGWYFYPLHLELITWDIKSIHYFFKFGYRSVFERQGMEWATLAFGLIAPLAWRYWRNRLMGIVIALVYITAVKVLDGKWALPPLPTILVFIACMGLILFLQFRPLKLQAESIGCFTSISLIMVTGFLLFSSINFFSDRYLFCLIPLISISICSVLFNALQEWHKFAYPALFSSILIIVILNIGTTNRVGDTNISYVDDIVVHQDLIHKCEKMGLQDAPMYGSFMDAVYMTDFHAGYLSEEKPFTRLSSTLNPAIKFAIADQNTSGEEIKKINDGGFTEIAHFSSGKAWTSLYQSHAH